MRFCLLKRAVKRYHIKEKKLWISCHILNFDYSKVLDNGAPHEVEYMQSQVTAADELIRKGTGAGATFKAGPSKTTTAKNRI